jgi:hypothetical protein
MGGERAQRAGPYGRVCWLDETDRGSERMSVRCDGQLREQQEETAQERAGPPHALPPDTAAEPGYRAPLLLVWATEGHCSVAGTLACSLTLGCYTSAGTQSTTATPIS